MKLQTIKLIGTRVLGRGLLIGRKYAPEILTGVGVVGVVTSAVMGARATLKLEAVVDHTQDTVNDIKSVHYVDEADRSKDLIYAHTRGVVDLVKLYGPSVSLMTVSIVSIIGGQGLLRKRNVALAAAYKALESSYNELRRRVVEDFGTDKDRDYISGVFETKAENEKGRAIDVLDRDPNGLSIYARFFDESNANYNKEAEYNLIFLRAQQNYFNDLLHARGHVFLNEVYDALGLEHSSAGAVVGWILDRNGDNHIDFGIYDYRSERARAFVNGDERAIALDFNVDGVIFDKI